MYSSVTPTEKVNLDDYQFKEGLLCVFYLMKEEKVIDEGPLDWDKLKMVFFH